MNSSADEIILLSWPRPAVAILTLNRPKTLNSMNTALVRNLGDHLRELAADGRTRVVVITGAGRGFSSGHELDELASVGTSQRLIEQIQNQELYSSLIVAVQELPLPIIAAVNGPASGGGMAIALAADTRVCSTSARFNAAFVRLGISGCDVGVSYLLPRIVGPTLAFEMMLTGRLIDADEALSCGLVLRVVPDDAVLDAALEIADAIVANSPLGVQMTKRAMWSALDAPSLRHAVTLEDRTQILALQSSDHVRAIRAVRDKTAVEWT